MGRQVFWIGVGVTLGGLLLWWSLRLVSINDVAAIIGNASLPYLALTLLASVAYTAVKTFRWRLLLQPVARFTFSELHAPVYIGGAANLVITHVGELVRARILSRSRYGVPASTVLASIGLERILDLFAMLLFIAYLFFSARDRFASSLAGLTDAAAVMSAVAALIVLSMIIQGDRWLRALQRVTRWLPERQRGWLHTQLSDLITGFKTIGRPLLLIKALLASLIQWLLIAFGLWCCAQSVDLNIGSSAAITVLVLMVFGLTLPTAPGYLGTTQVAFIAALAMYGVAESGAFAASVLYSAFLVLPQLLIGGVCFLRDAMVQRGDRQLHTLA